MPGLAGKRARRLVALGAAAVSTASFLCASPAVADEFYCRKDGKLNPTNFNWDGPRLNIGNRRKPSPDLRTGKLALTIVARRTDLLEFTFQEVGHDRGVNGCELEEGDFNNKDGSYYTYTYLVDFPEGDYYINNIQVVERQGLNRIFQTQKVDIKFRVTSGRVAYIGSYNISSDPEPLKSRFFHITLGSGGWRIAVTNERSRDFQTIDPENGYASLIDEEVPSP
jgi:hypothetical protein